MSFNRSIIFLVVISWLAGAFLNFDIFTDLSGPRDGFQEPIIQKFLFFVALFLLLYFLFTAPKTLGLEKLSRCLPAMVLVFTAAFILIIDLPDFKPGVYSFKKMPNHEIDSLNKSNKYKERFGPYYKNREFLSGKKIYCGPDHELDARFISLARMKQATGEQNYTLPFDAENLTARYQSINFPGSPKDYILFVNDKATEQDEFYLLSGSSSYYILPESMLESYREVGFAGGDGTREDAYQIEKAKHMDYIRFFPDSHFELTQDIDFVDKSWSETKDYEPIGNMASPFSGVFDGNGYSVENLHIQRPEIGAAGLFGYTDESSVIKNIELKNVNIDNSPEIPKNGLVGEWVFDFNQASGNEVFDTSESDNHALNHGASFEQVRLIGPVLVFNQQDPDAEGAYLDLGFAPDLSSEKGFTFSLWVNLKNLRDGGNILGAGHTSGAYGLFEHGQKIIFGFRPYDTGSSYISFQPELNRWYHIAGTYKPEDFFRLYVNGVLTGEKKPPSGSFSGEELRIGTTDRLSGSRANASYLDGKISRIHIYKRPLRSSEVKKLSPTGIAGSIAGINKGTIKNVYSAGEVKGLVVGKIAGVNQGLIENSEAEVHIINSSRED